MDRRIALFCVALGAAFLACSDPAAPVPECESISSLQVSAGLVPTFTWSPSCRVGEIAVTLLTNAEGTQGRDVWFVRDAMNPIQSGIAFGQLRDAVEQLQPGQNYRVSVSVIIGGDVIGHLANTVFSR